MLINRNNLGGLPKKTQAINGVPIQIGGESFKNGIGTLSGSKLFFSWTARVKHLRPRMGIQDKQDFPQNVKFNTLSDGNKLFYTQNNGIKTFVGVANSEENMGKGSVRFVIKGDGKLLWKSKRITVAVSAKVTVNLDLTGIQVLELSR